MFELFVFVFDESDEIITEPTKEIMHVFNLISGSGQILSGFLEFDDDFGEISAAPVYDTWVDKRWQR
jgi:hypothetical protein